MGVQLMASLGACLLFGVLLPNNLWATADDRLPASALMKWDVVKCWDYRSNTAVPGTFPTLPPQYRPGGNSEHELETFLKPWKDTCTTHVFHSFSTHGAQRTTPVLEEAIGVLLFSFAVVLVHLSTIGDQPGNGFSGLAVGFSVLAGVLAFGDLSTGLFNPALPMALYIAKVCFGAPFLYGDLACVGALIAVPFVGALLAVIANSFNNNPDRPAALITEAIGTFIIVLCLLKAPGSVGLIYVAVVYFGAHISFAHFNPAVTLAHYLSGHCSSAVLGAYAAAQTCGALLAGFAVPREAAAGGMLPSPSTDAMPITVLLAEFLVSLAIILVHLHVLSPQPGAASMGIGGRVKEASSAQASSRASNENFGLSVGFTFFAGFTAVSSLSGGIFNPAAGVGLFVTRAVAGHSHTLAVGQTLYYIIAPSVAAWMAGIVHGYKSIPGGTALADVRLAMTTPGPLTA